MNILDLLTSKEKESIKFNEVEKNKTLFYEGDLCSSVVLVLDGEIVIKSGTFKGKEIVYNTIHQNEVFGNNLIFSKRPFYKGDVVCTKNTRIAVILKQNLIQLIQSNKNFLLEYLSIQSDFGKSLNNTIKILSCSNAEERLDMYFYQNENQIKYTTITNLANKLGLERETLSRLISKLEKRHQLRRLPHQLIKIV